MKNLILLFILVCSFSAIAQNEIPKKAFKILVKNNLSADENFALVGRTLSETDFSIEKKDKEFYTIKSGTKELSKNGSGSYFLNFSIKEGSIAVTGQFKTGISLTLYGVTSEDEFDKISFIGGLGSYYKKAFAKMNDFALRLGSNIEYISE